ncbi:MAG: hypothetical protein KF704_13230, partial [Crocinitomicaceae bacterium]|nr:hypothetical protein [Crocinitomicaceae bacterium]NGF76717.1 hypothetical protein [Fluviicola sp. SGL-29]
FLGKFTDPPKEEDKEAEYKNLPEATVLGFKSTTSEAFSNPYTRSNGMNASLTGVPNSSGKSMNDVLNWFDEMVITPIQSFSNDVQSFIDQNPNLMRHLNPLPDAISIDFSAAAFAGPGTSGTIHVNWILKSPNASHKPIVSYEQTMGAGAKITNILKFCVRTNVVSLFCSQSTFWHGKLISFYTLQY